MHEGQSVVVLAVEVEQSRAAIGILVSNLQVTGQYDSFGKYCVDVVGHALAEVLHPGATEVPVFARWLKRSPLRPSRFLPMLAMETRHAA